MTKMSFLFLNWLVVFVILAFFSCKKENVIKDKLDSSFGIVETRGIPSDSAGIDSIFRGTVFIFNICIADMNEDWGTDDEVQGDCQFIINRLEGQFVQEEYRFRVFGSDGVEIKRLDSLSDLVYPDISGVYSYLRDGNELFLKNKNMVNTPAWEGIEFYCIESTP